MKSFFPKKSFEENVDYYAARCPAFVRIIIISTKSFLYYHGMMRAAAMTYNTFLQPFLFNFVNRHSPCNWSWEFFTDYLPYFNKLFSWNVPMEELMPLLANAEHIPLAKLGFVGSAALLSLFTDNGEP